MSFSTKKEKKEYKKNPINQALEISYEISLNIPEPPQNTLSNLVYNNEQKKIIEALKKTDPNERDNVGITHSWTPLYWSVKLRNLKILKLLLEHGADINLVINDLEECCGTVLDLVTLRGDHEIENILREYAEKEDVSMGQSFKAIRTKLRGKSPSFNFKYNNEQKNKNDEIK